jgi:hypothetical protein
MPSRPLFLACVLVLALVGAGALWFSLDRKPGALGSGGPARSESAPPAARPRTARLDEPAAVVVEVDPARGVLVRRDNLHAAGRRTPGDPGFVASGIPLPDGSQLPLLNGVASAPPVLRSPERGPLPPVVAVVVDRDGWDWYEHADGSLTTCRPQEIVRDDGRREIRVLTLHNAPDPRMRESNPASVPDSIHPGGSSR